MNNVLYNIMTMENENRADQDEEIMKIGGFFMGLSHNVIKTRKSCGKYFPLISESLRVYSGQNC